MKYVIGYNEVTGHFQPVVFGEDVVHLHIAAALKLSGYLPYSAGFLTIRANDPGKGEPSYGLNITINPDAKSDSLKLGPKLDDEKLLRAYFCGYTGLDLSNYLAYLDIQRKKTNAKRN